MSEPKACNAILVIMDGISHWRKQNPDFLVFLFLQRVLDLQTALRLRF
jgi:hypothetical protein